MTEKVFLGIDNGILLFQTSIFGATLDKTAKNGAKTPTNRKKSYTKFRFRNPNGFSNPKSIRHEPPKRYVSSVGHFESKAPDSGFVAEISKIPLVYQISPEFPNVWRKAFSNEKLPGYLSGGHCGFLVRNCAMTSRRV